MKKICCLLVLMLVLLALEQNAFALPLRIGLSLSALAPNYAGYTEEFHASQGFDVNPTIGLELSFSFPFSNNFDLQFGGTSFAGTKMKFKPMSGGTVYISDLFVNLRLIGAPISSLSGFQPYAGLGVCYGFVELHDIPSAIPLHGDLGYQGFIGGYIAKNFLVEIGGIRLNMKGPDVSDVYLGSGVYIKGGYSFNF